MKEVFLDGASNTPLDPVVFKAMKPYMSPHFVGNSRSIHNFGVRADQAIYESRKVIADCLGVKDSEVFFTSGATESNNWAIKSVVYDQLYRGGNKKHILCSATEHDSVLNCCNQVAAMGMTVSYIHPHNHRHVTLDDVIPLITEDTSLICIMAVNNETGEENEVEHITAYARKRGIKVLVDCTQAISYGGGCVELGKRYPDATFFTFSAHKIYGPLGVGCLISRDYRLNPLIIGGGQESGLRGGTSNTAGIVGTAKAVGLIHNTYYGLFYNELLSYLQTKLLAELPSVTLNTWPTHANIISLNCSHIINVDNLAAELANYGIAVSAGSACDTTHNELEGVFNGSHVLRELQLTETEIRNTIRVSFTKYSRKRDIDKLIKALKEIRNNGN